MAPLNSIFASEGSFIEAKGSKGEEGERESARERSLSEGSTNLELAVAMSGSTTNEKPVTSARGARDNPVALPSFGVIVKSIKRLRKRNRSLLGI